MTRLNPKGAVPELQEVVQLWFYWSSEKLYFGPKIQFLSIFVAPVH